MLLAACGDSSRPSAEESEQLDNAADMLDEADNELSGIEEQPLDEVANGEASVEPAQ